jgi:hypothetical protein
VRHALTVLALASCAPSCAGAPQPPPSFAHGAPGALFPAAEAAVAALRDLPPGLDPAEPATDWRAGDRVLYGIELDDAGTRRQWLLELRLERPVPLTVAGAGRDSRRTRLTQLSITITTKDGREIHYASPCMRGELTVHGPFLPGRTEPDLASTTGPARAVSVPDAFLRGGLVDACEQRVRLGQHVGTELDLTGVSDADLRLALGGEAALFAIMMIVRREESLADILWQVIDTPPLLSLLASVFGGVSVSIDASLERAARVAEPLPGHAWDEPGYHFPITITANGTPALHASVLVTQPRPPLQLAAGIVSIEGAKPSDPRRRVRVWVISARRGAPRRAGLEPPCPTSRIPLARARRRVGVHATPVPGGIQGRCIDRAAPPRDRPPASNGPERVLPAPRTSTPGSCSHEIVAANRQAPVSRCRSLLADGPSRGGGA